MQKTLRNSTQSFFMYKGIPYDIIDEYEDDGRFFIVGVSDDGEEATQEIMMLRKEQKIGAHNQTTT